MNSSALLHVAAASYGLNLLLGALVQWGGLRLGRLHHWLYALIFGLALAAAVAHLHLGLGVTLTALALLPFMPGGAARHSLVAVTGGLGYVSVYLS